MFNISKNGIITIHRGDTFTLPLTINLGTGVNPSYYEPKIYKDDQGNVIDCDEIFLAVLEPGQKWEDAIIKKYLSADQFDFEYDTYDVHFYSEDTLHLVPGNYYYEVKLRRSPRSCNDGFESIDTVVPRTKFIILE